MKKIEQTGSKNGSFRRRAEAVAERQAGGPLVEYHPTASIEKDQQVTVATVDTISNIPPGMMNVCTS